MRYSNMGSLSGLDKSGSKRSKKILYYKDNTMIKGYDEVPYELITTPDFRPNWLPKLYQTQIFSLQFISFNHGFGDGKIIKENSHLLQSWISKQKQLQLIALRFFKIDGLKVIKKLPIKCLLLNDICITNRENVLHDIIEMKQLQYLVQDNIFTDSDLNYIKRHLPNLNVVSWSEFVKTETDYKL